MALRIGDIVEDRYQITDVLGEGGMGTVYEAIHRKLRRKVAIKVLKPGLADNDAIVLRFEREAQAAGRIGSEHIVDVEDVGVLPSGDKYHILEYLSGESLSARLKKVKRMLPEQIFGICLQLLDGLHAAHEAGIVHRDLKPANIFLVDDRKICDDFVKILDFGVSKFRALSEGEGVTKTGTIVGTPHYMAPEQTRGARNATPLSDIYAVGAIMYRALSGRPPYRGETIHELLVQLISAEVPPLGKVAPGIEKDVERIVHKAIARDPAERYPDAMVMSQALFDWMYSRGLEDDPSLSSIGGGGQPRPSVPSRPSQSAFTHSSWDDDDAETVPTGPSVANVVASVTPPTQVSMGSVVQRLQRRSRIAYVIAGLGLVIALAVAWGSQGSGVRGEGSEEADVVVGFETELISEAVAEAVAVAAHPSAEVPPSALASASASASAPVTRSAPVVRRRPRRAPKKAKPKPGRAMRTDL